MSQPETSSLRLKVSPEVARIVKPGAPRDAQLAAARGALPLAGKDLLSVLFFLCRSSDVEIKTSAVKTLRQMPVTILTPLCKDESLHPQLLELMARARMADGDLMGAVIMHPSVSLKTLLYLADKAGPEVLERLAGHQNMLAEHPEVVEAIITNPAAPKALKYKLGWQDPESNTGPEQDPEAAEVDEDGRSQTEVEALMEEASREGMSKYQIALELKVAEKIKMALTGDKEWRTIMMKESNKLVQAAVMKNPRISDGEVLMVAKTRTSSDDLIRMILLNKDWVKSYEIKKALLIHPKTPPPKALRFITYLTMKDLKELAKSRQISSIVVNAIRKELQMRIKKSGG